MTFSVQITVKKEILDWDVFHDGGTGQAIEKARRDASVCSSPWAADLTLSVCFFLT